METLSKKLKHELCRLNDAYRAGSLGVLYYPEGKEDTPPKKAFIRVKRLVKMGLAKYFDETLGHPTYCISAYGLSHIQESNSLPES